MAKLFFCWNERLTVEAYGRNGDAYKAPFVFNLWISGGEGSASMPLLHCRVLNNDGSRSRWPRGLRRGRTLPRLLGLRVRIPSEAWMSVCCECCVSLRRTDQSSKGVLPTVVCLSVIEDTHRRGPGPLGLSSHDKKKCGVYWTHSE